jgi:hypothetical protein
MSGKTKVWFAVFIPAMYCSRPRYVVGAADQMTLEHVLVSHPPPKVKEGPFSTRWHWHVAVAGLRGSILHGISRQSAQTISSGQNITPNALLTLTVEKFDVTFRPDGARSAHDLKPTA